jgi:hypothetical protein
MVISKTRKIDFGSNVSVARNRYRIAYALLGLLQRGDARQNNQQNRGSGQAP